MQKNRKMIVLFLLSTVFTLLIMYLYPVIRTVFMTFFEVGSATSDISTWKFNGIDNYIFIFKSPAFRTSMVNMILIWLVGGVITLVIAYVFAIMLTSGIRFKKFFRAAIYMPNIVSAVALATMWIQYVFNQDYGLLNNIITFFGGDPVKWLGTDMKFWSMLIAFIFGAVGYYMLIFISGIEKIPADIYEAATIDGASKVQQAFKITVPLMKGVTKTNFTFWTINAATFYLWSKMFSPVDTETTTIVPVIYLYDTVFGSKGNTARNAGAGAAVGVVLCILILVVYYLVNLLLKDDDVEL